jgi:hypothetical protein
LSALCAAEPFLLSSKPKFESDYSEILSAHAPIQSKWFGPAFSIPRQSQASCQSVKIEVDNSLLLRESMPDWLPDVPYQQPFFAQVVSNQAVAVCASVRITDIAHEAGVETLENHRRKGHAAAVVSAWANAVWAVGAIPLYSTSFENKASQEVAAKLDMLNYGVDYHVS